MIADDFIAPFSLDAAPVRGRITRLGAGALNTILRRHDYPRPVAMLLGEALSLAALVGALLKNDGRLVVQAQGEGPVPLLVAEHCAGALRGYARLAPKAGDALSGAQRLAPAALLGAGHLVMTLDPGDGQPTYQGVVALDGDTLAACAQSYFRASEQTETRIRLAIGELLTADAEPTWRGGGMLMQRIAADAARGDPEDDWVRAALLFDTLRDEELIDPALGAEQLLYRLFSKEGPRMGEASPAFDRCTCTQARLTEVMRQFPTTELQDLVEPDGFLHAQCQFCARSYAVTPASVGLD